MRTYLSHLFHYRDCRIVVVPSFGFVLRQFLHFWHIFAYVCGLCGDAEGQIWRAQVISTELNRAVVELLQQLLFWQERAKATSPYNVAKRKRLVSGLRCACSLI